MGGRKLGPARMGRSISFTCSEVRKLGWLRIQRVVVRWEWSREIVHKGTMWWTWLSISASHRLGNRLLKRKCFTGRQHGRRHYRSRAGGWSYLEDRFSTDCAFSVLSDSLPVLCLLFGHRISFQPFGWPQSKILC